MEADDSMLSTPSSHDNDDTYDEIDENLIPETSIPPNDHLNAMVPGELSPPRTESNTRNGFSEIDADLLASDEEEVKVVADGRPGQGWKNKKAQDDMQRSWEAIVDRDYDSSVFGDVLNPK